MCDEVLKWSRLNLSADCMDNINLIKKAQSNPDLFSWDEAMKSEHAEAFLKSACDEVKNLTDKDTRMEDLKTNATNGVIPNQWVFKLKADSEGRPIRHKGRVASRGDLQEDDGLDNYIDRLPDDL